MLEEERGHDSVVKNPARTTNKRRLELIEAGHYVDKREYNDRYSLKDIKEKLAAIYPTCCCPVLCAIRLRERNLKYQAHQSHR